LIQRWLGGEAGLLTALQVMLTVALVLILVARELLAAAGRPRLTAAMAPAIELLLLGFGAVIAFRIFH